MRRTDGAHFKYTLYIMELYGLIGWPLGHSFSAEYFNNKFQREGIDAKYENFEMPSVPDHLPALLASHKELRGLNVTIPHKEAVIPLLDEVSDEARRIGAVNVIAVQHTGDGYRTKGYNSDIIGFSESIRPLLKPWHKRALVLGTGGASKAVIAGLEQLGVEPQYVSRTRREGILAYEDLTADVMAQHTVIVNCTPLGMSPKTDACPDIPYSEITPRHLLFDLIYNPDTTLFLKKGNERGAATKNGLEMLHLQAEAGWRFWHETF